MIDKLEIDDFNRYKLSGEIMEALKVLKYTTPTEIQKQVLPPALSRKDIIAQSETGSGKTAAFAIPVCEFARWEENTPTTLILEPTRELAVQVKQETFNIGRNKRLKVQDVFGGFPIDKQVLSLKQKSHIIVGTPGRVLDLVRRGSINLSAIEHLVIDEADLMLDMGFLEDVETIIMDIKKDAQIMLFSATIGDSLKKLTDRYMTEPVRISIESDTNTAALVKQEIYETNQDNKYKLFKRLLIATNPDKTMIFCGTREMVNVLCHKLARDGIKCGMLHGEIEQSDRIRTIEGFKRGMFSYLIATDVAARGIDVDNLSHVFNYDFPTGREAYVHRIGRTGRNGNEGTAISIVCENDVKMRKAVEEYINMEIETFDIEDLEANSNADLFWAKQKEKPKPIPGKGADFAKTITRLSISGGRKSKMRAVDIVGTICSIDGIVAEDIGIIDVRDSLTYVEILNKKGKKVLDALQNKTIKGKIRKVRITR